MAKHMDPPTLSLTSCSHDIVVAAIARNRRGGGGRKGEKKHSTHHYELLVLAVLLDLCASLDQRVLRCLAIGLAVHLERDNLEHHRVVQPKEFDTSARCKRLQRDRPQRWRRGNL